MINAPMHILIEMNNESIRNLWNRPTFYFTGQTINQPASQQQKSNADFILRLSACTCEHFLREKNKYINCIYCLDRKAKSISYFALYHKQFSQSLHRIFSIIFSIDGCFFFIQHKAISANAVKSY